jgi:hypothetical protein
MPFAPSKHARGLGGGAETGATAAVGMSRKLLQECSTSRDFCSFVLHCKNARHLVTFVRLFNTTSKVGSTSFASTYSLSTESAYFRTDGEHATIKNQPCRQHGSRRLPVKLVPVVYIHSHVPSDIAVTQTHSSNHRVPSLFKQTTTSDR